MPEVIFKGKVNLSKKELLQWLLLRNVKVVKFEVVDNADEYYLSQYLQLFGQYIRHAVFERKCNVQLINLVAIYCRNLSTIYNTGCKKMVSLCNLLKQNPTLTELRFFGMVEDDVKYVGLVSSMQLKRLSLSFCASFPILRLVSSHLCRLHLEHLVWLTRNDLISIARTCTKLEALALRSMDLSDEILREVTAMCPTVTCLDLLGNTVLTDAGMLSVVKNLAGLKMIVLLECSALTDHLAAHRKDSLFDLYADLHKPQLHAMKALLATCSKIRKLTLNSAEQFTAQELEDVFACTGDGTLKTDEILCLVGKYSCNVRSLVVLGSTVLHMAPCALAYGCPRLRVVSLDDPSMISGAVRCFWIKVRPQIQFMEIPNNPFDICGYPSNHDLNFYL